MHREPTLRRRAAALVAAVLLFLTGPTLAAEAPPRCTSAKSCLDAIASAQRDVESLRADFVQTKHTSLLSEPLVSRGHFAFRRPDMILWQVEEPEPMRVVVRGASLDFPGLSADERAAVAASPMANLYRDLGAVFIGDVATLERSFTVTARAEGGDIDLRLEPRDERARKSLSEIEVRFSGSGVLPERLRIRESLGDSVEIVLNHVERNPVLGDDLFAPPEDAGAR